MNAVGCGQRRWNRHLLAFIQVYLLATDKFYRRAAHLGKVGLEVASLL
jgi:hypothetical protein